MTKGDKLAKQQADAIQRFRQLPMLSRLTRLRGTHEYGELVAAWEAYRDATPGFKNAAPRPKDHWPIPCPHEGDEAFCRDCWASHADAEPYCTDKEYKERDVGFASGRVGGQTLKGGDVKIGDPNRQPMYGNQAIGAGVLRATTPCPRCFGTKVIKDNHDATVECPVCHYTGRVPLLMCGTCDYCEPRKSRCRKLESLPMVGEHFATDDAPEWCPIRCTFHIAAPGVIPEEMARISPDGTVKLWPARDLKLRLKAFLARWKLRLGECCGGPDDTAMKLLYDLEAELDKE